MSQSQPVSIDAGLIPALPARLYGWGARALYLGPALNLSAHRNAVAVLAIGLDQAFDVALAPAEDTSGHRRCRSVLVPPNTLHHFSNLAGRMAFLYVDALSRDWRKLRTTAREDSPHAAFDLEAEGELIPCLQTLANDPTGWPVAKRELERLVSDAPARAADPRVRKVLSVLHDRAQDRLSLDDLAASVGLSESRLRHLFKAATGVPLRRYRIWVAMRIALRGIARGDSMTAAGLDAGFASSAHFSSAFRDMFGMEPSRLGRGALAIG